MDSQELTQEDIVLWAVEYAGYEELETTAKALYGLYVERRKAEFPEEHKKAKKSRHRNKRRK